MQNDFKDFAFQLGLNVEYLENIILRCDYYYKTHSIKKKNGKDRLISSPNYQVKAIQAWILRNLLDKVQISQSAHGFVKRRGIRSNAATHRRKRYILCVDIKEFFPSIKLRHVEEIFKSLVYPDAVKKVAKICCFKGSLPQGGVTSPSLSNIYFKPIDDAINEFCGGRGILYSRYADDLTFSSNDKEDLKAIKATLSDLLKSYGLSLNPKKSRLYSGQGPKIVTGVYLNAGYPTVGRALKRKLRADLYRKLVKHDEKIIPNKLLGTLSFLKDVEPKSFSKFKDYIEKLKARPITED